MNSIASDNEPTRRPRGRWLPSFLLLALLAVPVSRAYLPHEIALWMIAGAENRMDSNPEDAQTWLERAKEWDPNIETTQEYLGAHMELLAQGSQSIRLIPLVRGRSSLSSERYLHNKIFQIGQKLFSAGDFGTALELLKTIEHYSSQSPAFLNFIAYVRSLVGKEPADALVSIDSAIEIVGSPSPSGLLDTKAWVLFRSKQEKEAEPWIQQAVLFKQKELDGALLKPLPPRLVESMEQFEILTTLQPGDARTRFQKQKIYDAISSHPIHSLAVMRYHRAKILESLGKRSEAASDRDWLSQNLLDHEEFLY